MPTALRYQSGAPHLSSAARLVSLCAVALAISAALFLWVPVNNDVSYQLWAGRQLRAGAQFGHDLAEVNPPLWFWEGAVLSALADAGHLAGDRLAVMLAITRSVVCAGLVLALDGRRMRLDSVAMAAGLVVILLVTPLRDYGERDVIMVLGGIAYATLIARRRDGARVPPPLVLAIATFAGYGFILKPHFILVPIALEMWLLSALRRRWQPVRAETVVIAVMGVTYLATAAIVAPAYFTEMLPLLRENYGDFGPPMSDLILKQPYAPLWLGAAAMIGFRWCALGSSARAAAVLGAACAASYFIQAKGFSYHAAPVTISLLWGLWLMLSQGSALRPGVLRVATTAILIGALWMTCMIGLYRPDWLGAVSARLAQMPPGKTVAIVSAHGWDAFPLVEDRGFVWPFRGLALWTLPAIIRRGDTALRDQLLEQVGDDLVCHPPDAIVFDDPERAADMAGHGFDYRRFLADEPRIAAILSRYRETARHGNIVLLETVSPGPAATRGCRRVAVRPLYRDETV